MARAIEEVGIPTVVVMMYKEMAEKVKPPRVAHVRFPFGRPLGEPNNPDQHRVIIEDALGILETATQPGTVVTLPYRWRREDYASIRRERATKYTIEGLVADLPRGKRPHEIPHEVEVRKR